MTFDEWAGEHQVWKDSPEYALCQSAWEAAQQAWVLDTINARIDAMERVHNNC